MSLLLVEALSSLLFDGSDVVASRRSFVGSRRDAGNDA